MKHGAGRYARLDGGRQVSDAREASHAREAVRHGAPGQAERAQAGRQEGEWARPAGSQQAVQAQIGQEQTGQRVGPAGRNRTGAGALGIIAANPGAIEPLAGGLIRALAEEGVAVDCFAPFGAGGEARALRQLGARVHQVPLQGRGFEPGAQVRSLALLARLLRAGGLGTLLGLELEGAVYAGLAGRMIGARRVVALIDRVLLEMGAGAERGFMARVRNQTLRRLYRLALARSHAAIFYNADDPEALARAGILPRRLAVHVVGGAGIDLARVRELPLPDIAEGLAFLMAAPLERAKGVATYFEAARLVAARGARARWRLYGPDGSEGDAIAREALAAFGSPVEMLAPQMGLAEALAQAHVVVLPAHAPGTDDVALQALAVARPLIVSDVRGLREAVDEGVNGHLVPAGDPRALARAMAQVLKRPDLIAAMAAASRRKAERLYDIRLANRLACEALGLGLGLGPGHGLGQTADQCAA